MVVIACMFPPPNRGGLNSTHIHGTSVPVEEPSTASKADIRIPAKHHLQDERIMHAIDSTSAGGMTKNPSRKKFNVVTSCLSRLSVTSQRMVASEPATDKFGPRSTPISTAPETCAGT